MKSKQVTQIVDRLQSDVKVVGVIKVVRKNDVTVTSLLGQE